MNIGGGYLNKLEVIEEFINEQRFDICLFQEMELELNSIRDTSVLNFQHFKAIPQIPMGGMIRTCIFVKNDIFEQIEKREDIMNNKVNTVWISFKDLSTGKRTTVGNFYREWSRRGIGLNNSNQQISDLEELEKQIEKCAGSENLLIGGDWNLDLEKFKQKKSKFEKKKLAEKLTEITVKNGLKHIEFGVTRIGHNNQENSAIDYFFIKDTSTILEKCTTDEMISHDHKVISIDITSARRKPKKKEIKIREKINDHDSAALDLASLVNGADIFGSNDPDECVKKLGEVMEKFIDKHMPWKVKVIQEGLKHAFDPEVEELKKVKRKLANYYRFQGPEREERKKEFRKIKNKIGSLLKQKEQKKVYEQLETINVWKVTKNLINPNQLREDIVLKHEGEEICDPQRVANIINEYYIDKIKKLVEGIEPSMAHDPYGPLQEFMRDKTCQFQFKTVGSAEVSKIIRKMRKTNAAGVDEISINLIKDFEAELLPVLVHIINRSIVTGKFPAAWKIAKVLPLYKNKGSKNDKKNFRPVSNLISFSKILEAVLEIQLREYFEKNKLILDCQYGFRQFRGTNLALIEATTKWKEMKKNKEDIGICFFDLSAAFDCLDREILDKKLQIYGVQESSRKLIKSYLEGRKQIVEVAGKSSTVLELVTGSPQGSVLSPLLYVIFCGDLQLWISSTLETITFADDTTIFHSGKEETEVISTLEENSLKVFEFFSSNKLVANKDKTCFLYVNSNRNEEDTVSRTLNIGQVQVNESESEKLLGMKIDNKLNWKPHISDIQHSLNHRLYQLRKIRSKISSKQLNIIGHGLAMSKLNYACSTFANSYLDSEDRLSFVDNNKKLQKCQNDLLRVITKNSLKDKKSVKSMLDETGYLSVNQMVAKQQLLSGWNIIRNEIEPLNSMIKGGWNSEISMRARSQNQIRPNFVSDTSFPVQLKKLWNHEDNQIFREAESKSSARRLANEFVSNCVPRIPWR